MRRAPGIAGLVLLGLVVAACGSTVPQAQQLAANGTVQGGLGSGALPPGAHVNSKGQIVKNGKVIGTTSSGITGGGSVSGSGGTAGTTGTSGGTGGTAGGSSGAAAAGGAGANGPGITASSIALGLIVVSGANAGNQALGAGEATSINDKQAWNALVHYTNQHGGIGGRRIIPVIHNYAALSSESTAQQEQEECNDWTQDHHVFAALTAPGSDLLLECMQKAGGVVDSTATIESTNVSPDHDKYPYFIEPYTADLDRAAAGMARGVAQQHYFVKGEKLGLVTFDDPSFKYARDHGLVPALRSLGVTLDDTAYLHMPQTYQEYGQMSNDAANAVLKFKTEGIDHVLFIDWRGDAAFFFMQAAEKQSYFPRYGLNSESGNTALADLIGQSGAKDQLRNAVSIGWVPISDTPAESDPDTKNPTRVLCLSVMRKNGVAMSSRNAEAQALELCDVMWGFKAQAEAAGKTLNQATFLRGVARLGSSYNSGDVWRSTLSSTIHDGVSEVANMAFFEKCTCFKYVSQPYRIER